MCLSMFVNGWSAIYISSLVKTMAVTCTICRIPRRVRHVLELLPWTTIWRDSRLHVPAAIVPHPLPNPQPTIRLHLWLDDAQTESCCKCCSLWSRFNPKRHRDRSSWSPLVISLPIFPLYRRLLSRRLPFLSYPLATTQHIRYYSVFSTNKKPTIGVAFATSSSPCLLSSTH